MAVIWKLVKLLAFIITVALSQDATNKKGFVVFVRYDYWNKWYHDYPTGSTSNYDDHYDHYDGYGYYYDEYMTERREIHTFEGGPEIFNKYEVTKTSSYEFLNSNTEAISIAVDAKNQSLYYLDEFTHTIYRLNNFKIDVDESKITEDIIHQGVPGKDSQIAFDWISRNLYWTDNLNNWIAIQSVRANDKSMFRILLTVTDSVAIALDPESGYLFYSDVFAKSRIERRNLLGEESKILLDSEDIFIHYMVADHQGRNIYYMDTRKGEVNAVTYEGYNARPFFRSDLYGSESMIFYNNHLCATFFMYMGGIGCYDIAKNNTFMSHLDIDPGAMAIYDEDTQTSSITNYCATTKFQHICVNTPTGARHVCKEGYTLGKDNTTCIAGHILTKKGILYTNGTDICVVDIRAISSDAHRPQCILSNLTFAHYLQASASKGLIFMWNNKTNIIQKYDVTTMKLYNLTTTKTVKGLFYDWVDYSLYWSEQDSYGGNYIRSFDLQTEKSSNNIYKNQSSFDYLTGNPHEYVLFWVTNMNNKTFQIEKGSMNGENRTVIVPSIKLKKPTALAYDETYESRIFWIDDGSLKSVSLRDSNVTDYHDYLSSYSHTLNLYKDYALWLDDMNIKAVPYRNPNKDKGRPMHDYYYNAQVTILTNSSDIISITYYDQRTQGKERAPCIGDNGGCQHLCTPTSSGPNCSCTFGYQLAKDNKTCANIPYTHNFALIAGYGSQIYQVPTNKTVESKDVIAVQTRDIEVYATVKFAYDIRRKFLYWTTNGGYSIDRSRLNGQNYSSVTRFTEGPPESLNIDESTGNLYYIVNSYSYYYARSGYIAVGFLLPDGEFKYKKLVKITTRITSLVIHPEKGYMFWRSKGYYDQSIVRSSMDGKDQKDIVTSLTSVSQMVIDYSEDRIYYISGYGSNINSVDLNGGNPKEFKSQQYTEFVAFQENYIFLSGDSKRRIIKIEKSTKKEIPWMFEIPLLQSIRSVVLVPGNKPLSTTCKNKNGYCSTFCLPTPSGKTCACEENVKMRDKTTCENVCTGTFPHGKVKDCAVRIGATCDYECDASHYKNTSIPKIKCLKDTSWNQSVDELCIEKRCSTNISNGYFDHMCEGKLKQSCYFQCNHGYTRRRNIPNFIFCSDRNGMAAWNNDETKLCIKNVYCNTSIPNGRLLNCQNPTPGTECAVKCDQNYETFISTGYITCNRLGKWNEIPEKICKPLSTCPLTFKNGKMINCTGKFLELCTYTCDKGKQRASINRVICLSKSTWSEPVDALCTDSTVVPPAEKEAQKQTSDNSAVVGGVMGAVIFIVLVVVVVVAAVFFMRRRKALPKYKPEPNVFFRSPPVDENTYSQFSNTDVGHLAVTQFSNPMNGLDPLYDNIMEKNMAADHDNPLKQDLKVVEEKTVDISYSRENEKNINTEDSSTTI